MDELSEAARPYAQRREVPRPLRIPRWLGAALAAAVGVGPLLGWRSSARGLPGSRLVRSIFFGSAFGYLATSLVDFAEHFRLERQATGHYLRATVVPAGETINHGLTIATILSALVLARPLPRRITRRDRWVLAAPGVFLALGWRDELVYHRRRSTHREDLMHTVSHLAAGVMWTTLYAMRLPPRR